MRIYNLVKDVLYLIAGLLVLVFNRFFLEDEGFAIPALVGACMLLFGADGALEVIFEKALYKERSKFTNALIVFLLGIVTLSLLPSMDRKLETVCVIWAVWSILRESEEICEKVLPYLDFLPVEKEKDGKKGYTHANRIIAVVNGLESLAIIVLAIVLLSEPGLRHAHLHVILLGIELLLEVLWKVANAIVKKKHFE